MKIILYDGICNFCNGYINYILEHDKNKSYYFVPSKSEVGIYLSDRLGIEEMSNKTIVLIDNDILYFKSEVLSKIALETNAFNWLRFFSWVPTTLKNLVYDLVSSIRHQLPSLKKNCHLPSLEQRKRYLLKMDDYLRLFKKIN